MAATQVRGFESGGIPAKLGGGPGGDEVTVHHHRRLVGHLQSKLNMLLDQHNGGSALVRHLADERDQRFDHDKE